jgi:hypothetical protein
MQGVYDHRLSKRQAKDKEQSLRTHLHTRKDYQDSTSPKQTPKQTTTTPKQSEHAKKHSLSRKGNA